MLGRVLRRPCADWQAKYGHGIALVETFVERDRFRSTLYQAANWQSIGWTRRRTRQDRKYTLHVPVEDAYVYSLVGMTLPGTALPRPFRISCRQLNRLGHREANHLMPQAAVMYLV